MDEERRKRLQEIILNYGAPKRVKTGAKRKHTEDDLQIQVYAYVQKVYKNVLCFAIANQRKTTNIFQGALLKRMGVTAGVPDLIVFWNNNGFLSAAAIELKAPKGVQSDNQKWFQSAFTYVGGKYRVCRSLDEVIDYLTNECNIKVQL